MKKRIGSLLLVVAMCLTLLPTAAFAAEDVSVWDGTIATGFAGGTGTESDPYQIADGAQLAYLAQTVNNGEEYKDKYFVLTADIDLGNQQWTPIGNSFASLLFHGTDYRIFAGNVDGKGYTILNLSIGTENEPLPSDVFGLFGAAMGKISNLNLNNISINGVAKNVSGYVIGLSGGLAGSASDSIENCHVTNLNMNLATPDNGFLAAYWLGGLVGALDSEHIEGCSVSGKITEKSGKGSVGGFIGELGKGAKISYSHADVALTVTADYHGGAAVGGFIGKGNGESDKATVINNCYATGNVTGGSYSGGFAGGLWGLNIENCYAAGNVTQAAASMASFVGTDASDPHYYGSIKNCYTTGEVIGTAANTDAFAQQDATERSPITNCYFVDTNSKIKNTNETATAKSLEEMKTEEFASTLNNGDTANGWIYKDGQTPLCGAEPADYSAVDAAFAKIPADLTVYTDETVAALNTAKANVVKGKVIAKQSEVNAWATAIEDAVAALKYKSADYTKVDEAIAKANALNKNDYTDFSAVEAAINAVDRTKNITEQTAVDAMATAIKNAIAGLTRKSSGSSGSSTPRYEVTAPGQTAGGTVSVSPKNASKGSTVTITVAPAEGYEVGSVTVKDAKGNTIAVTDKGNGKYTFIMPGSKVSISTAFTQTPETSPFDDVSVDAYYFDAVKWAADKGITGGVSDNLFAPDDGCTRAHIVTFLWRAAGSPEPKSMASFTDVTASAYYAKAVAWAVENGVTNGTTATTFDPDAVCTRAQAVAFLARALNGKGSSAVAFTDVPADSYYADAVAWAVVNRVTNGVSSDRFAPDNSCTRAQITAFLYRAYVK